MTYQRVMRRNHVDRETFPIVGDDPYPRNLAADDPRQKLPLGVWGLVGDLRRLEHDQRDEAHLESYAEKAGITPEQVRIVLDTFFDSFGIGSW